VRAKGHFWLATRPDWVGEMSQAGSQVTNQAMGRWWAAIPRDRWPASEEFARMIKTSWDISWGDRRQELVFIGIDMDEAAIRRRLDACLVKEQAFVPKLWTKLADPFPVWGKQLAAA
jgi:G3E family GTPase